MSSYEGPLATFTSWPHAPPTPQPKDLAAAGFTYRYSDSVRCTRCSLELSGWEPRDNAVKEHSSRSPQCMAISTQALIKDLRPPTKKLGQMSQKINHIRASKKPQNSRSLHQRISASLIHRASPVSWCERFRGPGSVWSVSRNRHCTATSKMPMRCSIHVVPKQSRDPERYRSRQMYQSISSQIQEGIAYSATFQIDYTGGSATASAIISQMVRLFSLILIN